MKKLASRLDKFLPSQTIALSSLANRLIREGHDIVNLTAGEPDFPTPAPVKNEGISAIRRNQTHYTATAGTPELINAVKDKFKKDNGLVYGQNEIVISSGAKHSVFNALLAIIEPGDEVLIPSPCWVTYPELVKFLGGRPVMVKGVPRNNFKVIAKALASACGSKTKAIILNSPVNPTGAVYERTELKEIAKFAISRDLYVISDEIYEKIIYGGARHVSIASLSKDIFERTITINGVSKAYSMTGWRIGYLGAPKPIARAIASIQSQTTHHPSTVSMAASVRALKGSQSATKAMVREFRKRRNFLTKAIKSLPGVKLAEPDGAFYVFPDVSALFGRKISSSQDLSRLLLERFGVAVVPGSAFDEDSCIRISYAYRLQDIKEGFQRIKKGIETLCGN